MRTGPPRLLPMFRSEMQVSLLALLLLQPDREWTLDELSKLVGAPTSSVHRELRRAVDAGIIVADATVRPHRFAAAVEAPVVRPLRELLEMTAGLPGRLRSALEGIEGVRSAAIHGSWARGRIRPDSDVDVFVVTSGDRAAAARAAEGAIRGVGREPDITVVDGRQLREMLKAANPFARRLLNQPRIELIGTFDYDDDEGADRV